MRVGNNQIVVKYFCLLPYEISYSIDKNKIYQIPTHQCKINTAYFFSAVFFEPGKTIARKENWTLKVSSTCHLPSKELLYDIFGKS